MKTTAAPVSTSTFGKTKMKCSPLSSPAVKTDGGEETERDKKAASRIARQAAFLSLFFPIVFAFLFPL